MTSTSTGTFVCDGTGDCFGCQECALNGPCQASWDTCLNNPDCLGMLQCFQMCADEACPQECFDGYPGGQSDYLDLAFCILCDACYTDCDGGASGCP